MPLVSPARSPTARYTLVQSSYWVCYCSIITFSSVYLLSRNFSNSQIGLLIGGAGVLSAVLQPFVSVVSEAVGMVIFCLLLRKGSKTMTAAE